jgi:hypothetical protein
MESQRKRLKLWDVSGVIKPAPKIALTVNKEDKVSTHAVDARIVT